ncbi:MAG: hypothetical protein ACE14V_08040 [bacterium]
MKKWQVFLIAIYFAICLPLANGTESVSRVVDYNYVPKPNEFVIAQVAISIPVDNIILIKKKDKYGTIKFTKFWAQDFTYKLFYEKEMTHTLDHYASYQSYFQGDGSGDFSKSNIKIDKGELAYKQRAGFFLFFVHCYRDGNDLIHCGSFNLFCDVDVVSAYLYFYNGYDFWGSKKIDNELEFAPTKWTQISEVNVFDSRLKWYKYEENRNRFVIPIDKLWEDDTTKQDSTTVIKK